MQHPPESKLPLSTLVIGVASAVILVAMVANASTAHRTNSNRELDWISHLAHDGDAGAQLQLGLAYRDGRYGLEPDAKTGRYWLSEAARHGNDYAADLLANTYAKGEGGAPDSHQAVRWWEVAAREGNADAQTHLGQYLLSQGREDEASNWLRRAANRGDDAAHAELTKLYRKALVSPVDLRRGENSLAVLGERLDSAGLKTLSAVWNTVELSLPNQQSATTLLQRANQGDPLAEYQLALHFRDGAWAVKQDPEQADLWFHRAASDGNPLAISALARKSEF
jgi:TPR repeat protein